MRLLSRLIARFQRTHAAPAPAVAQDQGDKLLTPMSMKIHHGAVDAARGAAVLTVRPSPFQPARPMPGVAPQGEDIAIAMDSAGDWAMLSSTMSEGLSFMGYPYLSELTQRPEYRRPSEILANEMTRKWIRFQATGDTDKSDKLAAIEAEFKRLNVQDVFRQAAEHDGFFGRAQIYIDTGDTGDADELKFPLSASKYKIRRGGIKRLKVIEPMWTYPDAYNSSDPLRDDFYRPTSWFVFGKRVHASRMLTMVSREVPDILKPAYAFGGLSLSQMAKPYIDNWLRTRQSVSDAINNFSTTVLQTNMGAVLNGGAANDMLARARLFTTVKANNGLMILDKDAEDLKNVSMPLSGLDHLQAQAQEHMSAVTGIPLVVLLGITPSGLNASSEGELQTFYAWIESQQEAQFTGHLSKLLNLVQLSLFGEIDPEIGFKFNPLRVLSDKEQADVRKTEMDTDAAGIQAGILDPHEARVRLASDEDGPYASLDLEHDPEPPQGEDPNDPNGGGQPGGLFGGDPGGAGPDDQGGGAPDDRGGDQPPGGAPAGAQGDPNNAPNSQAAQGNAKPRMAGDSALPIALDAALILRALAGIAQDDEHWITLNGGGGKGTPALINGHGVIIGGAGGKMNGVKLDPKSKSAGRADSDTGHHKAASALQNRNRNSAASIAQMTKIAAHPNPRLLMAAPTMNDGAPVVTDLGRKGIAKLMGKRDHMVTGKREVAFRYAVVEASDLHASNNADGTKNDDYATNHDKLTAINNGRTAGLQAAYANGKADDYKKAIARAEGVHGISGSAIRKMKAPVLVRVMDAGDVGDDIGDESNSTHTLSLSATEQAQNDAKRFDPTAIDYNDDGTPSDASVKGFINAMPESERQSLAPNGKPTKQAIDRMQAAAFHAAYADPELVGLMAQATDPESKNLIGGMSRAAGAMAKLADCGDLDVRSLVTGAAKQIINAVRSGVGIKKFLTQGDLLTSGPEDAIASMFAQNARSAKAIGERLQAMATFAAEQHANSGVDMFGETIPTASREDVLGKLNHES